jgi:hypothetical protein
VEGLLESKVQVVWKVVDSEKQRIVKVEEYGKKKIKGRG